MLTSADCDAFPISSIWMLVLTLSTQPRTMQPRDVNFFAPRLRPRSTQFPHHQPLRIPNVNLPPRLLVDVEAVDHRDGRRDRPKRRVGGEDDVVGPEEFEAARNAVFAAEHRRVAVELLEIFEAGPLDRVQHLAIV